MLHILQCDVVRIHGDSLPAAFSKELLDVGEEKLPQDTEHSLHHLPCVNMTASLDELNTKVLPNIPQTTKVTNVYMKEQL